MDHDNTTRRKVIDQGNFWYLFAGLLITLLALPFANRLAEIGRISISVIFSVFMLVAVWSLSSSRLFFHVGVTLVAAIALLIALAIMGFSETALEPVALILILIFASLSAWIAARNVFVWHRADPNSLVGALCVYLLMGLNWAIVYRLLLLFGWGGFAGAMEPDPEKVFPDLVYFSFVTLASLGYGDIQPIGTIARTLAYLEAVIGQFYLAVMVASLVGAYMSRRHGSP